MENQLIEATYEVAKYKLLYRVALLAFGTMLVLDGMLLAKICRWI